MTTNIQLLRSSVPYKRPSAAPLLEGQVAINYNAAEPGLFYRLTDGRLAKVGPVAITNNGVKPNEAPGGETGNALGETWLNAQPTLYSPVLYVFDGNDWVTANGFKVDITSGDFSLDRVLTVNQLVTNELYVYGNAVIGGNITPNGQNCAYYLGLPNERWDYGYLCNLDVSKNGLISIDLTVGQDASITRDIEIGRYVSSNLVPDGDVTRSLGSAGQRWSETHTSSLSAYGNTNIGELCSDTLTVNATTAFNCEVDFSAPIQIDQIGTACTDTLTIFATTTVKCPTTFESPVKIPQIGTDCAETLDVVSTTTFKCGVDFEQPIKIDQIGESCADTLTVNATTTFKCPVTFEQPQIGDIVLGNGCVTSTINLNGAVTLSCDMVPNANNTRDIGTASNRLKALYATDIYTGDLHLKNEKGDWTMIEAEDYLTIRNNKTGKTFRLLMEEV